MCGLLFVAPGSTWLILGLVEDKEKQIGLHGVSERAVQPQLHRHDWGCRLEWDKSLWVCGLF